MKSIWNRSGWIAGLLACIGLSLHAADFAVPAEGPVPFRRDKIPLDADAMANLSERLVQLVRAIDPKTPVQRRGAAQGLALSIALDPANMDSRDVLLEYQEGRHKPTTDAGQLGRVRSEIGEFVSWLKTPEAGQHGNALADCLEDIARIFDPGASNAGDASVGSDRGAWSGWIPGVAEYESRKIAGNAGSGNPGTGAQSGTKKDLILRNAEVQTLLWKNVGKIEAPHWALAKASLQMTTEETGSDEDGVVYPFSIRIGSDEGGASFERLGGSIHKLLLAGGRKPPPGFSVLISSPELETSIRSNKLHSISAATAVLASSAFTGLAPSANAIILGQIDETGAFNLPSGFWDQLLALGKGDGQRLVLPLAASEELASMLAMEKPGFFLEYEVLLAADFKELTKLVAAAPGGNMESAMTNFHEVQSKAGNQVPREYIANRFVRQRMAEIYQMCPNHFSAKMLLLQASGSRPTWVSRRVLAAEILHALEPMDWVINQASIVTNEDSNRLNFSPHRFSAAEIARFNEIYDLCRSRLDALERYVEKNDLDLLDRARKANLACRTLYRANRTRGEYETVIAVVRSACFELVRGFATVRTDLALEAGISKPAKR